MEFPRTCYFYTILWRFECGGKWNFKVNYEKGRPPEIWKLSLVYYNNLYKITIVTLVICKSKLASGAWVSTWRGSSLTDVTSPSCFWNVASASDWSMDVRVTDVRSSYRLWNVTSAGWSAAEWGNDVMYLRGVVSWAASHSALGVGVADVTYSHVTVHVHLHILKYKFI